jgi:diguanylate cyclase (GGDEF)-like protein
MAAAAAPQVDDEQAKRLAALERYDILDTPKEDAFERVATLIQLVFGVDTSIVSMIDGHRQWYKAARGSMDGQVPIEESFCRYTVESDAPLVVPDATLDERFKDNQHVTGDAHVRFYAGVPLRTPDGVNIGTLCAIDSKPRDFSSRDTEVLQGLASIVMSELELRQLATSDSLTGVLTRRAFKEDARKFVAQARRHRTRLSAVTFDLDHFKAINDTYGHAAGDKVLVAVTQAASKQLRASDLLGRLGGEEFVLLLPDTDTTAALAVAEKLRGAFRALRFAGSHPPIQVSASFGVATLDHSIDDIERLLVKADEALYSAKNSGRNRSVAWAGSTTGATKQVNRRRVLKAGTLIFNHRKSTVSCTVRGLWDTGADLELSTTVGLPDELALAIRSDDFESKCRIVNRQPERLEVEFI